MQYQLDALIIQRIASFMPTPLHMRNMRAISRAWRDALNAAPELARVTPMSARALLILAASIGDLALCIEAREAGAKLLASFDASRPGTAYEITDMHRAQWFAPYCVKAIGRAIRHGHAQLADVLCTWSGCVSYKEAIARTRIKNGIICEGSRWRGSVGIYNISSSTWYGESGDVDAIDTVIRGSVPDQLERTVLICALLKGVAHTGDISMIKKLLLLTPSMRVANNASYDILLISLKYGHLALAREMMRMNIESGMGSIGDIAYYYAGCSGSREICEFIMSKSTTGIAVYNYERMLHGAVRYGYCELCEWILSTANFSEYAIGTFGHLVIRSAKRDHWKVCEILRKYSPRCFGNQYFHCETDELALVEIYSPHLIARLVGWFAEDGALNVIRECARRLVNTRAISRALAMYDAIATT